MSGLAYDNLLQKHIKEVECQYLYNDSHERQSTKPIVRRTTQSRTYSGIKFKICSTMLLYSKEE